MDVPCILIVEDDPVMSMHLETLVGDTLPCEILTARSLAEAEIVADRHPDFALLDVDLGDGTTYAFATRLVGERVPFAFVSASNREALPAELRDVTFVTKPYDDDEIVALLHVFARTRLG